MNSLMVCYCNYKWNYKSVDEMLDKWEEDDSSPHTMIVFKKDGVVLILCDSSNREEKISYETFVGYMNDGLIKDLYDWEASDE